MSKRLDVTFELWLRACGNTNLSKLLKVTPGTISHWLNGAALPRAKVMKKIVALTNGRISYAHIIEGSCSPLR